MSLNIVLHFGDPIALAALRKVVPKQLGSLGVTVRFDDLLDTGMENCLGVGMGDKDLVIVDPMALLIREKTLVHWKSARPLVSLVIGEHSDSHVFIARSQTAIREITWKDGKLTRQQGLPLAGEAGIDLAVGSVSTLWALSAMTGYADDFNQITYDLYCDVGGAPALTRKFTR